MTLVLLALILTPSAFAIRPVSVRISWLEQRVKVHRFGCRHDAVRRHRFHCEALVWTRRELAQARSEWEQRWDLWLPAKWQRIGACETGYGKRPGNWHWDSGTYVSAFGIARAAYRQFALVAGVPDWSSRSTPREQYAVALAIWSRFGYGAWGCGGA